MVNLTKVETIMAGLAFQLRTGNDVTEAYEKFGEWAQANLESFNAIHNYCNTSAKPLHGEGSDWDTAANTMVENCMRQGAN